MFSGMNSLVGDLKNKSLAANATNLFSSISDSAHGIVQAASKELSAAPVHCGDCGSKISVLKMNTAVVGKNTCYMCRHSFCKNCLVTSPFEVPVTLRNRANEHRNSENWSKDDFEALTSSSTIAEIEEGKVAKDAKEEKAKKQMICKLTCLQVLNACRMRTFREEMQERFQKNLHNYLLDTEHYLSRASSVIGEETAPVHFPPLQFFDRPDGSVDTTFRQAMRAVVIAEAVAGLAGYDLIFKAAKYLFMSEEIMRQLIGADVLPLLTPLQEAMKEYGITGPTALMKLYYIGCKHVLEYKMNELSIDFGEQDHLGSATRPLSAPPQHGVINTVCPIQLLDYVSHYAATAQWLYIARLPPPHSENGWSCWYLSKLISRTEAEAEAAVSSEGDGGSDATAKGKKRSARSQQPIDQQFNSSTGEYIHSQGAAAAPPPIKAPKPTGASSIFPSIVNPSPAVANKTDKIFPQVQEMCQQQQSKDKRGFRARDASKGWTLIMSINDTTILPNGLKCPAFALCARCSIDGSKEALLTIRGTKSSMDWAINLQDEVLPYEYNHAVNDTSATELPTHPNAGNDENRQRSSADDGRVQIQQYKVSKGFVHKGIYNAAMGILYGFNVRLYLFALRAEGYEIKVVGHSLGAGVATLIAADLRNSMCISQQSDELSFTVETVGGRTVHPSLPPELISPLELRASKASAGSSEGVDMCSSPLPRSGLSPRSVSAIVYSAPPCVSAALADAFLEDNFLVNVVYEYDLIPRLNRANCARLATELKELSAEVPAVPTAAPPTAPAPPTSAAGKEVNLDGGDKNTADDGINSSHIIPSAPPLSHIASGGETPSAGASIGAAAESSTITAPSASSGNKPAGSTAISSVSPTGRSSSLIAEWMQSDKKAITRYLRSMGRAADISAINDDPPASGPVASSAVASTTTPLPSTPALHTTTTNPSAAAGGAVSTLTSASRPPSASSSASAGGHRETAGLSSSSGIPTADIVTDTRKAAAATASSTGSESAAMIESDLAGERVALREEGIGERTHLVTPGPIVFIRLNFDQSCQASLLTYKHPTFNRIVLLLPHMVQDHLMGTYRDVIFRARDFNRFLLSQSPTRDNRNLRVASIRSIGTARRQSIACGSSSTADYYRHDPPSVPKTEETGTSTAVNAESMDANSAEVAAADPPSASLPAASSFRAIKFKLCSVCGHNCTWPYITHSDATQAFATHMCRKCGSVVCTVCGPAGDKLPGDGLNNSYVLPDCRIPIPSARIYSPQRVCLPCYFEELE